MWGLLRMSRLRCLLRHRGRHHRGRGGRRRGLRQREGDRTPRLAERRCRSGLGRRGFRLLRRMSAAKGRSRPAGRGSRELKRRRCPAGRRLWHGRRAHLYLWEARALHKRYGRLGGRGRLRLRGELKRGARAKWTLLLRPSGHLASGLGEGRRVARWHRRWGAVTGWGQRCSLWAGGVLKRAPTGHRRKSSRHILLRARERRWLCRLLGLLRHLLRHRGGSLIWMHSHTLTLPASGHQSREDVA